MGFARIPVLAIFLVLFMPFPAYGQRTVTYNNEATVCVEDVNQMGHLNFFTWSAKQILDFLARDEFLKDKEWKSIENHPRLLLSVKSAADLALEISESTCPVDRNSTSNGVHGSDDEVDAIRHFVMSAYLSMKAGPQPARTFMAAHEGAMFENPNMMDYYNNNLGFEFGERLRQRYRSGPLLQDTDRMFREDILREIRRKHALPRGHQQDFLVLTSGPSVCARRKYPNF